MPSVEEIQRRQEQWRAEGKYSTGGNRYYPKDAGEIAFVHFLWSGRDDSPYFETYLSHQYPATAQARYGTLRYCPVQSGFDENYACPGCAEGLRTKPRMMMWFYIHTILHPKPVEGLSVQPQEYNGRFYYPENIEDIRVWETSAWRDSPLDTILMYANMADMRSETFQLLVTGEGTDRRYKPIMVPNTGPLTPEQQEKCKAAQPILQLLAESIAAPATMSAPDAPGSGFQVPGAAAATGFQVPGMVGSGHVVPGAESAPAAPSPLPFDIPADGNGDPPSLPDALKGRGLI